MAQKYTLGIPGETAYKKSKIPVPESQYLSQIGLLSDLSHQVFFDENIPLPENPKATPYNYPTIKIPPAGQSSVEISKKPSKMTAKQKAKKKKKKRSTAMLEKKLDEILAKIEAETLKRDASIPRIMKSKSMECLRADEPPYLRPIERKLEKLVRKKSNSHPRVDRIDSKMTGVSLKVKPAPYPILLPPTSATKARLSRLSIRDGTKHIKAGGKWRTDRSHSRGDEPKTDQTAAKTVEQTKVGFLALAALTKGKVADDKKGPPIPGDDKKDEKKKLVRVPYVHPRLKAGGKGKGPPPGPKIVKFDDEKDKAVKAKKAAAAGKEEEKPKTEGESADGEKAEKGEVDSEEKEKKEGEEEGETVEIVEEIGEDGTVKKVEKRVKKGEKEIPALAIKDSAAILRLISLCQKNDWHGAEMATRYFEKAVLTGENLKPLDGVSDEGTGWTPLMYAIKDGRIPLAERLLSLGCNINAQNKDGETPLIISATHSKDETVRFLLFKKADTLLQTNEKKETAIHAACKRPSGNGTNILKSLLHVAPKDARLIKDSEENIPLVTALESGNKSACIHLLHHLGFDQMKFTGGELKDTPLHLAIRKKELEIARTFVDAGANVDAKNADGQTPLHIASATGDESVVKFFYMCKANANIADKEDRTPIHIAAEHGHTSIIELLADKFKVSVHRRTKDGSTLMHIASLHGHPETAMILFKKGVPLQMPNKFGSRSIHIAAKHGHGPLIRKLLEKGEKVDATTNDNYTALHIAVEYIKPSVVETLLGHGAEVHIKGGKQQETPLHIASRVPDGDKCAQMLLKSGADPNIIMENGDTPLHVASKHGRLKMMRLLLNEGADPIQKSKTGETPLQMACRYGHLQVIKVLIQHIQKEKGEKACKDYINSVTAAGESALHYASKLCRQFSGKTITDDGREIAQLLLNGGGSTNIQTKESHETPFHYCSREGNNEILMEMIARMNPVESQRAINRQSNKGMSPLLLACHKGHVEVAKTLLSNSARVDVFDNEGNSALHLAAEHGFQEVCKLLLDNKAYINAKSRIGFTALHYGAKKGYKKLCIFLIQEYQAFVDVVTLSKQTPLHLAAEAGELEVCRLLMGLRASADATDEKGQKPIHLAAQNNHSDVIKLFLKHQSSLVTSSTKDGSTCAHLAAEQGSIAVLEELMKFDKNGVISARNRTTDATALQLAAEGGHAELVKALLDAGASATDENKSGFAAVHSAAKNGHTNVIEALRQADAINLTSRKLGLNALHVASHFGQAETVRELLAHISATTLSEPPISLQASLLKKLGLESGLTPLHLGAFSGEENVVRLLLNYPGVQVDAPSANLGYNPLHLACIGGYATVVGLLLSRSSELLESKDKSGKTGLHLAATEGHFQMCEILLGQGAEIDSIDKESWTPLHCAAKAGHLDVIKLLLECSANPLAKNSKGQTPIWFAAAENEITSLMYLMRKDHDTYGLMEDKDFLFNLTICGKNNDNEPIDLFILSSPAPVDVAAKLSATLEDISTREKERAKDLSTAAKHCEGMAAELLSLASGAESAGKILNAVDRKNVIFLDVLLENEQKEVIAHTVVQRYLQELWVGSLDWESWKLLLLFFVFIFNPVVWVVFTLPLGHQCYKIPIIKFMSFLTSHVHLMILFSLTSITPIEPIFPIRTNLFPYWYEWFLLIWLIGLCWGEISNPSDKAGLGWIKLVVIVFSFMGMGVHIFGLVRGKAINTGTLLYSRNQLFALSVLCCCVQILDFLSFHYLFGPWAIIIGNLMKDLARFLAVLMIFMVGFSMVVAALNHPLFERGPDFDHSTIKTLTNGLPSGILVTPIDSFELLFFGLFGLQGPTDIRIEPAQPEWTTILFKIFFGIYLLVTVIVLINLLIAMMSDTYQRIQAQSDIEWKYGLARLIRNLHKTKATPTPINIFTGWIIWLVNKCAITKEASNPLKDELKGTTRGGIFKDKKPKKGGWRNMFKKSTVSPGGSEAAGLGGVNDLAASPAAAAAKKSISDQTSSQASLGTSQRIENAADWPVIAKKYRALVGKEEHIEEEKSKDDKDKAKSGSSATLSQSQMSASNYQV